MALAQAAASEPEVYSLAAPRIRRCTFRRLVEIGRSPDRLYEVECLYPDRVLPMPLGDLDGAMPICNECIANHVFRADED